MEVIKCTHITKNYGNIKALKDITFAIEENKITGIIGRNGAGKTTLLKIIAGYAKKTSGEIAVLSEDPFNSINSAANTIFVDDNMKFPITFTLGEVLKKVSVFYSNWDMALAESLFTYFEFNPKAYHGSLSKGMKSCFNSIIGLASHSTVTIFDEPTTGMDTSIRKDFYRALLKDYIKFPRTILMSSHLISEIDDLLEDVLIIKNGEVCLHKPVEDLKEITIAICGKWNVTEELMQNREFLSKESNESYVKYIAFKKDFNDDVLQKAIINGIKISSVELDDLCVYLTGKVKGGIDDVLK